MLRPWAYPWPLSPSHPFGRNVHEWLPDCQFPPSASGLTAICAVLSQCLAGRLVVSKFQLSACWRCGSCPLVPSPCRLVVCRFLLPWTTSLVPLSTCPLPPRLRVCSVVLASLACQFVTYVVFTFSIGFSRCRIWRSTPRHFALSTRWVTLPRTVTGRP